MGERRRRYGILLAMTAGLLAGTAGPALAQTGADPTVVTVVTETVPALPAQVVVEARSTDGLIVAANPTATPLLVLAPDGTEFLRISAAGVETNAAAAFTYESRHGADTRVLLPPGAASGAPARWTRVSDDVSWRWYDPRVRPTGLAAPAGGRADVLQTLSSWTVPMRYGTTPVAVDGAVQQRAATGWFRTIADQEPGGISAVVTDDAMPGVVLAAPPGTPVTVLGLDGEDFLRRTASGGWEVSTSSRTYLLALVGDDRPVPAATGWVPWSGAGSVSWRDERLRHPLAVPPAAATARGFTDVARWSVPVRIGDRTTAITGVTRYTPRPGADTAATSGVGRTVGLVGGVLALAVLLGALAFRQRHRAPEPEKAAVR